MDIRPAGAADAEAIGRLLAEARLDASDLASAGVRLWVHGAPGAPQAVVGLELHGTSGLLRSLAVAPAQRGAGLGRGLTATAERAAAAAGVDTLYLLTTTAAEFFTRRGYQRIDRAQVPAAIRATAQFASLCPSTAVVMRKPLRVAPE